MHHYSTECMMSAFNNCSSLLWSQTIIDHRLCCRINNYFWVWFRICKASNNWIKSYQTWTKVICVHLKMNIINYVVSKVTTACSVLKLKSLHCKNSFHLVSPGKFCIVWTHVSYTNHLRSLWWISIVNFVLKQSLCQLISQLQCSSIFNQTYFYQISVS